MTAKADSRGCADMLQAVRTDRRGFVKAGILGTTGLSLAELLRWEAKANQLPTSIRRPSVIILWMRGGPSHIDTWDPKPYAPVEFRGEFGRTQRVNNDAGRDHYPNVFSAAIAGGPVQGGRVVGNLTPTAPFPRATQLAPRMCWPRCTGIWGSIPRPYRSKGGHRLRPALLYLGK